MRKWLSDIFVLERSMLMTASFVVSNYQFPASVFHFPHFYFAGTCHGLCLESSTLI